MNKFVATAVLTAFFSSSGFSSDCSDDISYGNLMDLPNFSNGAPVDYIDVDALYIDVDALFTSPPKKRPLPDTFEAIVKPGDELKKNRGVFVNPPVAGKSVPEPKTERSIDQGLGQEDLTAEDFQFMVDRILDESPQELPDFALMPTDEIHKRAIAYRMEPIRDFKKSFDYLLVAANEEYGPSLHVLGLTYLSGIGVHKDPKKAFLYFHMAAKQNEAKSLFRLGAFYEKGVPGVVAADINQAMDYYRRARDLGFDPFADQSYSKKNWEKMILPSLF